ncbi:MAG: TonB-dependent receptor, partial [Gemmatimonadetes bacterium]|nr:TonB-dependent receptor [Gemmatimonadota bacterium]
MSILVRPVLAIALLLAVWSTSSTSALAQTTGSVRGRVTEASTQRPLPGAAVSVAGTNRRVVTGSSGEYTLPGVPAGSTRVRVELVGYSSSEQVVTVSAGQAATANFALGASAVALDELVVTGTAGDARRRTVGNAVSQIQAADVVATAPINNLQELINGRAPGVVIIPGTGQVGTGSRIRIRGISSLSLSQEPLVYVDGVRVNNAQSTGPVTQGFGSNAISRWNDFNPEDIESIEIIKGPAAATLFGTEAANGVIQIITKKGVIGRPRWNATVKQGTNSFANPQGRLWTNYARNPASGEILSIDFNQLQSNYGQKIFQTGHQQEYDLNVGGGSEGVRYFVGGSYERSTGIEPSNRLNRLSTRANLSIFPSEKVDIVTSVGYVSGRTDLSLESGAGGTTWTTFWMNPLTTLPLANGQPNPRNGFHSATPEAYYHAYLDYQDLDRFTGSVQMTHRPLGWFTQRFTVGTDLTREDNVELVERIEDPAFQFFFSPGEIRGYKDALTRNVTFSTLDYSGTASLNLRPGLASNTSVGAQFYRRYSEFVSAFGEDFPARGLRAVSAASTRRGGEDYADNTTIGVFVQQQFGWQDRLFLTGAIRADDNSAFGENFDLVYYPKLSGAWVVSEEPFWNLGFVDQLRLRAAYGESGQQPGTFDALRIFRSVTGPDDVGTVTPDAVGNPDLGPERGSEVELGFDAGFLNERLGLEFTYYNQRTRD